MSSHQDELSGMQGALEVEDRFSIVPEWLLFSDLSDRAVRLYAVLLRYGNTSGARMPGRATLSRRLGCSTDSVDRAVKQLELAGALEVHRDTLDDEARQRLRVSRANNRYRVRTSKPTRSTTPPDAALLSSSHPDAPATPTSSTPDAGPAATSPPFTQPSLPEGGSRTGAARGSRTHAARGSRTGAATCTESAFTESVLPTPPPAPRPVDGRRAASPSRVEAEHPLLEDDDLLAELVAELCVHRRERDLPTRRWTRHSVRNAIVRALDAGYEPDDVATALRAVAIDSATELPGRLAAPGTWWDVPETHELQQRREARQRALEAEQQALDAIRQTCNCDRGWIEGPSGVVKCSTCHPAARPSRSLA